MNTEPYEDDPSVTAFDAAHGDKPTTISGKAANVQPLKPQLGDCPCERAGEATHRPGCLYYSAKVEHTPGPWQWNQTDAEIWPTTDRRAPIATIFEKLEATAKSAALKAREAKKHWQHMVGLSYFFPGMEELVKEAEARLAKADAESVRTRNVVWEAA